MSENLNGIQIQLLLYFLEAEPKKRTVTDAARYLNKPKSTLTHILDSLDELALMERVEGRKSVLERVNLAGFLKAEQGLDTPLLEKAGNLSGGQCQRLALARALLHDSPVYIFDEATSNIDVESENDIMAEIHRLAKTKTVLLISHRLANVVRADNIYVLENGSVAESGSHEELLKNHGLYEKLWNAQQALENYGKDGDTE